MIERIIGATIVPDIQALTWADQIGWLVKPWTKSVQTGTDQFKDIVYPVAPFVTTEDCQVQDYGLNVLTTDKGYTSLILISAVGDMTSTIAENIPQRRAVNIEQDIKISVWMNNHQGSTHIAKAELMKTLFNKKYSQVEIEWPITSPQAGYEIYVNKLKVSFVSESNGSPFNEYTFSKDQAQFNNNYSAFEMVFKLTGLVFPNCLPEYPELTADLCETPTNTPQVEPSPGATPGIYTPTVTIISGVDTLTVTDAQYARVGNTVTVSGAFNLQTAAVGVSAIFELSLPISSNLGQTHHLAGVYSANDQVIYGGNVTGSIANNRAVFSCLGEWESGLVYSYTFTYRVII